MATTTLVTVALAQATLLKINGNMSSVYYKQQQLNPNQAKRVLIALNDIAGGQETKAITDVSGEPSDVTFFNLL